jgi:diguanylate cyclase (GGDEF)-like protein
MIARWGGEEFIMLFPSTDGEAARVLIERIAEAFTRTTVAHFDGEHITFSAGITSFVGGQQELKNAFDQTDRALYAAKSGGRNRVVLEEPF